jgi:hypothetical protein
VRLALGIASVAAFFATVADLRLDWKGRAEKHREAASRLSKLLAEFDALRRPDGTWPSGKEQKLQGLYWDVMTNIAPIPDGKFNSLKAAHLRKVEISRLLDQHPGCPIVALRAAVFVRSTLLLCGVRWKRVSEDGHEKTQRANES